jgi:hypothetical protein
MAPKAGSMTSPETHTGTRQRARRSQRLFTPRAATAALVFVRKVVQDIVDRYAELMALRAEREELSLERGIAGRVEAVQARIAALTEALNRHQEELTVVGCELKDWSVGCVDFPAVHGGRPVWLCWQLGEPEVAWWHEPDGDLHSRQPIGPGFG